MKTTLMSAISSMEEVQTGNINNPLLTVIKFIFSDNQANSNHQGINEEEFSGIANSSINMPVKMKLSEGDVAGHDLSIPIGHIIEMENVVEGDIQKLVASAVLYKQEFPEEVNFLKEKFNTGEAPGISWELAYKDSAMKDGIEWLKSVITAAATFVKSPAYGSRTALLAIASSAAASSNDEVMHKLEEIVNLWKGEIKEPEKGGMTVDELEKAKAELAEALERIKVLEGQLTEKDTSIETLTTENASFKKAQLITVRTNKYTEAGFTLDTDEEKKAAKIERWLSMSDAEFDGYITELVDTLASVKTASASAHSGNGLPRLGGEGSGLSTISDLKEGLRRAARGEQ